MDPDLLSAIVESAPDALVTVRNDGSILHVNRQAERLFGYAREELLGAPLEALIPERYRERHLRHVTTFMSSPHMRGMVGGMELFGLRRDGTEFPAEISLSPMQSDHGLLVTSAIRDVTNQRRTENLLRGLLETAPDAVVVARHDGTIYMVNAEAERIFGYQHKELHEQAIEVLVPERFRSRHIAHRTVYQAAANPRPMGTGMELYGLRKDGTEFPVEISLSPIETADGLLVSSGIRDITDRRREQQLMALGQLAGGVAHEIRTPLGVISNSVYFLKMVQGQLSEDVIGAISDIERETRAANGIVSELLDYVRSPQVHPTTFLAEEAMATALSKVELPDTVECATDHGTVITVADLELTTRILANLIRNAVQAMPHGGSLTLRTFSQDSMTAFEVTDTGVGIPQDDINKVFEPLFTSKARGIGLGLSVSKRYAELNRGRLEVTSTSGAGSTFRLLLPGAA